MSDMNTPEVSAAETAAPEVPTSSDVDLVEQEKRSEATSLATLALAEAPPAAEPAVEAPVSGPEAPLAVPVLAQSPSSADTEAPEDELEDKAPVSLEDAARAVVIFVRAHRTIGDADLAAAIADVEAALPAQATEVAQ